jgi:exopolyphosphatase/guanosine-5'-triphosphate,3'-diphosphate pyrophosphatase
MESVTFAAIDVGSNAMRIKIVEVKADGSAEPLYQYRAPVRLGHEVFLTGFLDEDAVQKAIEAFGEFRAVIENSKVYAIRAIATSATREAINGDDFVKRIYSSSGIQLDRISGGEEARLVQLSVTRKIDLRDKIALVIDIGGGSVEFDVIDHGSIVYSNSLRLGTVRLCETFLRTDVVSDLQVLLLKAYMEQLIETTLDAINAYEIDLVLGTGGNVEELGNQIGVDPEMGGNGFPEDVRFIPLRDLQRFARDISKLSVNERMDRYEMRQDRADVILPGSLVLAEVVSNVVGVRGLYAANVGLKEGVLVEMIDRFRNLWDTTSEEAEILKAATALGHKYHFHLGHAQQVRYLAELLFDQLQALHQLSPESRMLLRVAATLHEIGGYVNASAHHKHSYYLIKNSEIVGLTSQQSELIANIARYHRKAFPNERRHPELQELSYTEKEQVTKLAAILRIADALDHQHKSVVQDLKVNMLDDAIEIDVQSLDACLLENWHLQEKGKLFTHTFGHAIRLLVNGKPVEAIDITNAN